MDVAFYAPELIRLARGNFWGRRGTGGEEQRQCAEEQRSTTHDAADGAAPPREPQLARPSSWWRTHEHFKNTLGFDGQGLTAGAPARPGANVLY